MSDQLSMFEQMTSEVIRNATSSQELESGAMRSDFPDEVWTGSCPCFAAGTMVLTDEGYRPIESLVVGDLVLTQKGRWRPVNAAMSRDGAELWRIRAQGVPDVVTTREQPFWTRCNWRAGHDGNRSWSDPSWKTAEEVKTGKSGDYLSQVLPATSESDKSSLFWYLVGRYLADGWRVVTGSRNASRNRVIICCARDATTWLAGAIERAGFKPSISRERTVTKFSICDPGLYAFLNQFGDKAHGKRIPRIALELPYDKCRALVEGYLSGDGYREESGTNSGHRATTVSRSLALGIALLAQRSHGVIASVRLCPMPRRTVIEGREVNQRDFYIVSIPDRNRSAIIDGDYGWKLARVAEPAGIGRVYNIGVEEDESYCADGAIVHNCQPFRRNADWVLTRPQRVGDRPGLRPVERGAFPLAHGASSRVGRLRGYGDGIVAQAAQAFIEAYLGVTAQ